MRTPILYAYSETFLKKAITAYKSHNFRTTNKADAKRYTIMNNHAFNVNMISMQLKTRKMRLQNQVLNQISNNLQPTTTSYIYRPPTF